MVAESPEYHMEIEDMTTDLSSCGEHAKVMLQITATGRPPGLTRAALGVATLRKIGGRWSIVSHHSFRTFVV